MSAATPQWLLQPEVGLCPCGCIGKRRRGSFVEKTIRGAAGILQQAIFNDDVAKQPGLLQRLDARAKLLSLVALLVAAALVEHVVVLVGLYLSTIVLAAASRLSIAFFLKRVWLFIPIFTGIVVIPAMFSFVTPGEVVVPLWDGGGLTRQGITSALLITMRVATSISLVVLLTLTTPWPKLLAALRGLRVPQLFVLVVGMAYRYIFVLLASVEDMYVSRKARTLSSARDTKAGRRFVGATAGALFGKAHALSEEIHQAMVARGFTGEAKALDRFQLRFADVAWLAGCALAIVLVLGVDRGL